MKSWRRHLAKAWRPTLWYLFAVLLFHLIRRDPRPGWHNVPDYLETGAGFLLGMVGVSWFFERRIRSRSG